MKKILFIFLTVALSVVTNAGVDEGISAFHINDFSRARKELLPLANSGSSSTAQYYVGRMYNEGKGVKADWVAAQKWFAQAAASGHVLANYELGRLLYEKNSSLENLSLAFIYLSLAAKRDVPDAQYLLGKMYYEGAGVKQNFQTAFQWFSTAGANGSIGAIVKIGLMYRHGQFVRQDYFSAMTWFNRGDLAGDPEARFHLAEMYEQGLGVNKDFKFAFNLYKISADDHFAEARYKLAKLFGEENPDIIYDLVLADALCLSIESRSVELRKQVYDYGQQLVKKMSPTDVQLSQKLAKKFAVGNDSGYTIDQYFKEKRQAN
jgi:TPR repeat protein